MRVVQELVYFRMCVSASAQECECQSSENNRQFFLVSFKQHEKSPPEMIVCSHPIGGSHFYW